jgi:hypothetical protein
MHYPVAPATAESGVRVTPAGSPAVAPYPG